MAKVVAVTGANRGIGRAIAIELHRRGHVVGCLSRSGQAPAGMPAGRAIECAADVTDESAMRAFAAEVANGRRLVGVVNNAGLHTEAKSAELTMAAFDQLMAVNGSSVLIGCQAAYPHLRAEGGLIVNIGSFFDKLGVKRNLAYCASKAAVGAITRVLGVEWARDGIAVVNVAPGYVVTDLNRESIEAGPLSAYLQKRIPAGRAGDADDVARLVAGLFAMDVRYLSGETIYVDGGQGIAH